VARKRDRVDAEDLANTLWGLAQALSKHDPGNEEGFGAYQERLVVLPHTDAPGRALSLRGMGDVRYAQARYVEAAALYRQVADTRRSHGQLGDLAIALALLGRSLAREDPTSNEALATFRDLLALRESFSERNHAAEGATLHDIADVLLAQDDLDGAI